MERINIYLNENGFDEASLKIQKENTILILNILIKIRKIVISIKIVG